MKRRFDPAKVVVYLILVVVSIITLYPLFWMVSGSLKRLPDIILYPWSLPPSPQWHNYPQAWTEGKLGLYFLNSVIVSTISVLLIVIISSLSAFSFARYKFRFDTFLFFLIIGGLMVPLQITLIPLYLLFRAVRLLDTYWAMILPSIAFGLPISVFILRTYFMEIPRELIDSATIDGCSELRILWHVFIPIAKAGVATLVIYNFIWTWNLFFFALIFVTKESLQTITLGLMTFRGTFGRTNWSLMLSGITIATFPVILVFLAFQRHFIKGVTAGAIK
jgi:raffinose/stachyose/melibiose transport system permease protein